jgi:hypothetical protein
MIHLRSWIVPPAFCLRAFCFLFVVATVLELPAAVWAITFPYVDDFQDGTTKSWTNGGAPGSTPTENIPSGGPSGAGDGFLKATSDASSGRASSKLVTFNTSQWMGNYNSADVAGIGMDLKYITVGDPMIDIQPIRIALDDFGSGYSSANGVAGGAFSLPNDGQWHHWTFSLAAGALTTIGAPPALSAALSNMPQLRILSSAAPDIRGTQLTAQLGIDNISAVPSIILGDLNRDSHFNAADIQAMANALADLSGYQAYWGLTNDQLNALANFDGGQTVVTNRDLQGLINALANAGGGARSAVPEPTTLAQTIVGGAILLVVRFLGARRRLASRTLNRCLLRSSLECIVRIAHGPLAERWGGLPS